MRAGYLFARGDFSEPVGPDSWERDDVIARRFSAFLDERFGTNAALRAALAKIFPDHWSFYLGEFALYSFVLLVATGIWLTFVYDPSPAHAYESVAALGTSAPDWIPDPPGASLERGHASSPRSSCTWRASFSRRLFASRAN